MQTRLLNLLIRASSMLSRFLLIMILAKLLPESELGIYGLIVAAIGLSVIFVGFDYYAYSNRELLSLPKEQHSEIILNQFYAYLPLYLLFIPVSFLIYEYQLIPEDYFVWFLLLMVIEHISIEQNRLLNTIEKQLSASFVLFFRSGLWVYLMLPILIYIEKYQNLETVLYAWLMGGVLSIVWGTWVIVNSVESWKLIRPSYGWIIKGYKLGMLYVLGTLAFKAISTGDRFLLEKLSDVSMVGVYVFYVGLTLGASAFIHAGVIVFSTPKIIASYQAGEFERFEHLMRKFLKELLFSLFIVVALLYFLMPFLLEWIGKSSYVKYYDVFYIVLGTMVVTVIGSHPNTYLYAARRDKYILGTNLLALLIFIITSWLFYLFESALEGIYVVSWVVLYSSLALLLSKYFGYWYFRNKVSR